MASSKPQIDIEDPMSISLIIAAHGTCEDLCGKYEESLQSQEAMREESVYEPAPTDCISSLTDFDNSPYVKHINLYSLVPYGIENVAIVDPLAQFSDLKNVEKIRHLYNLVSKEYSDFTEDQIIETLLRNWVEFETFAFIENVVKPKIKEIKPDFIEYLVKAINDEIMGKKIIVKEKYNFSFTKGKDLESWYKSGLPRRRDEDEYSGIFGMGKYSTTDFTVFDDILKILPASSGVVANKKFIGLIHTYIECWNNYIQTKYDDYNLLTQLNRINFNPIKIIQINNESLYHILFFIFNYINDAENKIVKGISYNVEVFINTISIELNTEKFIQQFEAFLTYICDNMNITLNLLSFACRSVFNVANVKRTASQCAYVNSRVQKKQLSTSMKASHNRGTRRMPLLRTTKHYRPSSTKGRTRKAKSSGGYKKRKTRKYKKSKK